jgi:potassium efflux system protein
MLNSIPIEPSIPLHNSKSENKQSMNDFTQYPLRRSQVNPALFLSGARRKLLVIAITVPLSLIALPVEAEGVLTASKSVAEKPASYSLNIQDRQKAVQSRLDKIRSRLALLPSVEAEAPPEAMASEWTEYRRLLNLLVIIYESHLDSLNKLKDVRVSRQDFQEKSGAWQQFPEPGPYSVDFVDDLWNIVQAKDREIETARLEQAMFVSLLEAQRSALINSEQALRKAAEALETSAKDSVDRARWLKDLNELRNLYDEARMAAVDTEREHREEMLAYRLDERALLQRKALAASRVSPLTKDDLDAKLAILDRLKLDLEQETQQALEKDKAIQALLGKARSQLREALEGSASNAQEVAETQAPDVKYLQQELDVVTAEAQASTSNLNVLRLLAQAQVARRHMWHLRYSIEQDEEDIKTLDDAQAEIQQGLKNLDLWREYLKSDLDMARRHLEDQQKRLTDWKSEYGDYALGQRRLLAYSIQETSLRRVVAEADNLDASLRSLHELLLWRHDKSSFQDRLKGLLVSSGDMAAAFWNFELLTVEDKIVVEGHEVINKRSVTVGKILHVLLILGIGFWLTARISDFGGRLVKRRLSGRESASLLGLRLFSVGMAVGLVIIALVRVHIPLTVFTFFGGALAIGFGFGAQNIINNFISGLILLAERAIKLGDIVEVDGVLSRVTQIGSRCCQVHRFDGIDMLIPNSTFLEKNVTNWTLSDKRLRCTVSVGITYGSPVRRALALVERAAAEHPQILKDPVPDVYLQEFADNALSLRLDFWVDLAVQSNRLRLMSDVRLHIEELFAENGIMIAFPQRDVHLDMASPVKVELTTAASGARRQIKNDLDGAQP